MRLPIAFAVHLMFANWNVSSLQAVASVQSSDTAEAGLALGTGVSAILLANYIKRIFDTGAPNCRVSCVYLSAAIAALRHVFSVMSAISLPKSWWSLDSFIWCVWYCVIG